MSEPGFDFYRVEEELRWLQDHPWFEEKPASMPEFLGPGYLNIEKGVRAGVRTELITLFGDKVNGDRIAMFERAMFTGAIGIGKTTMASIILPYMAHWVLCLRDPQDFYGLLPGSRIAFMQMSTSEDQALETIFGDIKARIEHSEWFLNKYPFDPKFTKQIRFKQKDIWILPGNSAETRFEGYNILGGILDEADSHKKTKDKDYADVGYDAIDNRISSRYQDRGFLLVIGQMKSANGFASKKYKEFNRMENAHTVRMTIWESFGWDRYLKPDGTRDSFWYDSKRKEIVPDGMAKLVKAETTNLIEVPSMYRDRFENNPEKALRDLAGIPPATGDAFISLTHRVDDCFTKWQERYPGFGSPVTDDPVDPQFEEWFKAHDPLKRAVHLDIAYSSNGDALTLSMGHIAELLEFEGEEKPRIVFDFLLRMTAAPGTEIFIANARKIIYNLKNELNFKIRIVTMDGFQSTETRQQLMKNKVWADYLSVDKSKLPYEDLRDAIYEGRLELPPYMTYLRKGETELVNIAYKELTELTEDEKKIDHPPNGSKDVADGIAGVVTTLMGDRTYRRGVRSDRTRRLLEQQGEPTEPSESRQHQQGRGAIQPDAFGVPRLPSGVSPQSHLHAPIPPSLQPRRR